MPQAKPARGRPVGYRAPDPKIPFSIRFRESEFRLLTAAARKSGEDLREYITRVLVASAKRIIAQ